MSHSESSPDPSDEIQTAISKKIRDDAERGEQAPLSVYVQSFPEHVDAVAELWVQTRVSGGKPLLGSGDRPRRIGAYVLESEIGRGGQGIVYRATDERLRRRVALKVLTGLGPDSAAQLTRFRREAEVASRLDHPGICGVYETGIEEGVPFIAMRYVEGETLSSRVRRAAEVGSTSQDTFVALESLTETDASKHSGSESRSSHSKMSRADLDATLLLVEKIARALHAAHESGIVHRDIKPGNIMIDSDDQPVILDFGLARDDSDDTAVTLTQSGDHFGTPAYMSPEQISGSCARLDRRSDVFSLAVVLFECLTLNRPFQGPTRESLYQSILRDETPDPRRFNRRIPQDLKAVLECALEKNRDSRYATACDFADDLAAVRELRPIAARRIGLFGRGLRWARRHPVRAALAVVLAIGIPLVAGLGGYIAASMDDIRAQEETRLQAGVEEQVEEGFLDLIHSEPEPAILHFERALELESSSVEAAVGLALSLVRTEREADALKVIEGVQATMERPESLAAARSEILGLVGREEESKAALATAPEPDSPMLWFIASAQAFERARRPGVSPSEIKALLERAEAMGTRAVMSSTPRRAYHYHLASIVHRRGKDATDRSVSDAIVALWPDRAESWFSAGLTYMGNDPEKAEAAFRKSIEIEPDRGPFHGNLGMVLARRGRYDEAIESYRESLRLEPSAFTYHNLANLLRRTKRLEEAVDAAHEAIALAPEQPELHAGLAQSLSSLGRTDESMAAYEEAIRLRPGYPAAHINLGVTLVQQNRVDEAIEHYEKARAEVPTFAPVHYVLGNAYRMKEDFDKAVAAYRETIRLQPTNAKAHRRLGDLLTQLERHDEAVVARRATLEQFPGAAQHHLALGESLEAAKDTKAAAESYQEAIKLDETLALAHCKLGLVISQLGRHEEAFQRLKKGHVLSLENENWSHPSDRWLAAGAVVWARHLEKAGNHDAALEVIEEALAFQPDFAPLQAEKKRLQSRD